MTSFSGRNKNFCFALSIACAISILLISAVTVSAQTFSPTGSMSTFRDFATSTHLLNGKVLVAGRRGQYRPHARHGRTLQSSYGHLQFNRKYGTRARPPYGDTPDQWPGADRWRV
jgi:hypothetical protein